MGTRRRSTIDLRDAVSSDADVLASLYRDAMMHLEGDKRDWHAFFHSGKFEECNEHRCYGYRWLEEKHRSILSDR